MSQWKSLNGIPRIIYQRDGIPPAEQPRASVIGDSRWTWLIDAKVVACVSHHNRHLTRRDDNERLIICKQFLLTYEHCLAGQGRDRHSHEILGNIRVSVHVRRVQRAAVYSRARRQASGGR